MVELNQSNLNRVIRDVKIELDIISGAMARIKSKLKKYADNKELKGDEMVGWLGEVYAKSYLNGKMVANDNLDHDVVVGKIARVSVKARRQKDEKGSWKTSSRIPRIKGPGTPTHLLFVRLNENYEPDRMWLFEWADLLAEDRFKEKKVRRQHVGWTFSISEKRDKKNLIYPNLDVSN